MVVVDELSGAVPDRYAELPGMAGISCTPVAAAGHWLGVIFADRNGEELRLDLDERRTMHALGRTAALATTVRHAAAQRERDALLLERIELAREVHESVMQRLFGVSMVLGSGRELSAEDGERSAAESRRRWASFAMPWTARWSRPPSPRGRPFATSCSDSVASTRRCR